jgi:thermitase
MATAKTQNLDPTDGTTPITLPTQDACCQSPCDPAWLAKPSCTIFTETKSSAIPLASTQAGTDAAQGVVLVNVSYEHRMCLTGKQHGGLAYTLTLLPGEKMTLYQSDRYRRTTSETERYSVQTTFAQFVSALYQQQNASDSSQLQQVLNSQTQSGNSSSSVNVSLFGLGGGGGSSSKSGSGSNSSANDLSTQTSSNQFTSLARQSAQYTDVQRSITISSYEDSETVSTTQRTLANNNRCYAVTYFVRKVLDVYKVSTQVTLVTFQVNAGNYVSPVLTPAQIDQVDTKYRAAVAAIIKGLPAVGDVGEQPTTLTVPTDGVVYDAELAHCCAQDPELEQAAMIRLERDQAEAQKIGLEIQLMALEVQRRQALLAAGTLDPFVTAPATTVVA